MNKKYRLKKNEEISALVTKEKRISSRLYNFYYSCCNPDTLIAVVAGKKCGDAVIRNYEKRVMREIMRTKIKDVEGYHIVLVAKTNVLNASFQEKQNDIEYLIRKSKRKDSFYENNK